MRILGAAPVGTVEFWGRWDGSHGSVDVPCTFSRHRKPKEIQKVRGVLPARDGNGHVNQPATKTKKANTKEGSRVFTSNLLSFAVCLSVCCLFVLLLFSTFVEVECFQRVHHFLGYPIQRQGCTVWGPTPMVRSDDKDKRGLLCLLSLRAFHTTAVTTEGVSVWENERTRDRASTLPTTV